MSQTAATTETTERPPEDITFEDGYSELKGLVDDLKQDDVPVHEMFDKFRRGKGLEKALRSYLTEREGELQEIEEGRNVPEFRITAASRGEESEDNGQGGPNADFETAGASTGSSADDIPF